MIVLMSVAATMTAAFALIIVATAWDDRVGALEYQWNVRWKKFFGLTLASWASVRQHAPAWKLVESLSVYTPIAGVGASLSMMAVNVAVTTNLLGAAAVAAAVSGLAAVSRIALLAVYGKKLAAAPTLHVTVPRSKEEASKHGERAWRYFSDMDKSNMPQGVVTANDAVLQESFFNTPEPLRVVFLEAMFGKAELLYRDADAGIDRHRSYVDGRRWLRTSIDAVPAWLLKAAPWEGRLGNALTACVYWREDGWMVALAHASESKQAKTARAALLEYHKHVVDAWAGENLPLLQPDEAMASHYRQRSKEREEQARVWERLTARMGQQKPRRRLRRSTAVAA